MSTEIRKRKADEQNGQSNGKRARVGSPIPIVLDEFETEAKREVEASAGLTGGEIAAGQTISLIHQASDLHCEIIFLIIDFRLGTKSRFPLLMIIYQSLHTNLTVIQLEHTPSN